MIYNNTWQLCISFNFEFDKVLKQLYLCTRKVLRVVYILQF